MDKMAIFVEGQTEQEFMTLLVTNIAGRKNVHIDKIQASHGKLLPRRYVAVSASRPAATVSYYVLIYDCGNDSRVLSDIRETYNDLTNQGFREIIGIRDVYPQPDTAIPMIRSDFRKLVKKTPIEPSLILAIREIEAWFIAEYTHFPRRHPALNLAAVTAVLGYDPSIHDVQTIPHPADDLKTAYNIAGLGYSKRKKTVQALIGHLDYTLIYIALTLRIPDLQQLVGKIDAFLSPPLVPRLP